MVFGPLNQKNQMVNYTKKLSLPYLVLSSPSFQESTTGQKPTTFQASALKSTLLSPNPHLSGFRNISTPIFHLTDVAYGDNKLIIRALKYEHETVLLCRLSILNASIVIVDAVPSSITGCDLHSFRGIELKIVGFTLLP